MGAGENVDEGLGRHVSMGDEEDVIGKDAWGGAGLLGEKGPWPHNEGDEDHAQERRAEQKEHRRLSLQQAQEEDSEEPQQQGGWNPFSA